MRQLLFFLLILFARLPILGQDPVQPGAVRMDLYLDLLKGKQIALVGNHTSLLGSVHLLDTLLASGIQVVKVFSPEHGFRGEEDAGEKVSATHDRETGIPILSLYGKHVKPQPRELQNIDLVLFDLQDVGVRFYTYLSTLHYVMEACAENGIPLVVLDRPNPNGSFVDGPVLDLKYKSYVGMHPVPVVYGMTIGEYARMINGEGWLAKGDTCSLRVVPCKNYTHASRVSLPVKPSPNLPDELAVCLYPSLAFFEGTNVSVGRGTLFPFTVYGSPGMSDAPFSFTPHSISGMSKNPPYEGVICHGWDLRPEGEKILNSKGKLDISYLLNAYRHSSGQTVFFNSYFNLLAGNSNLQQQLKDGLTEREIRASWEKGLKQFQKIREKYVLYPD
jgi:uncharacterized protein YbbC (DUF1343 family)